MEFKKFVMNGLPVTFIKTSKFKTVTVQVHFMGEFNEEMATRRKLLSHILDATCAKYNTDEKVALKSMDLYNVSCYASTYPINKACDTYFTVTFITDKYLPKGENIISEAISFLSEFILRPNIVNGLFSEKEYNEKKKNLEIKIKSTYNNPSQWAVKRMLQNMSRDEIFSVSSLGTIEALEKITPESLIEEYNRLMEEDAYIYVCGDLEEEKLETYLSPLLCLKNNKRKLSLNEDETMVVDKVKEVIETRKTNQATLVLGYRIPYNVEDDKIVAFNVFNMMFGGCFSSSLFQSVREQNSLAYNIYSSSFNDCKVMMVVAGIDEKNYELTTKIIASELKKYQDGEIDEELLKTVKEQRISEMDDIDDSASSMIAFAKRFDLYDNARTKERVIELISLVKKEDIQEISQKIYLDTIYLLKSGDVDEN